MMTSTEMFVGRLYDRYIGVQRQHDLVVKSPNCLLLLFDVPPDLAVIGQEPATRTASGSARSEENGDSDLGMIVSL